MSIANLQGPSAMGRRMTIVSRSLGATARALLDRDRRAELSLRVADYVEYDGLLRAISREHAATAEGAAAGSAWADAGSLLVTTNEGLFLLSSGNWHRLFPIACFGIARHGSSLFLGASAGLHSFVLRGRLDEEANRYVLRDLRVLFRFETRYHNERIHQIAYDPLADAVLCANTRRTSLLTIDPAAGGMVKEELLFEDGTGFPVYTDQAHLNSVMPHGRATLFAMHNAGNHGSALGFVLDGRVRAYAYPARGVHDVLIHDDSLMFTDSFRADRIEAQPDVSGVIRYMGHDYLADLTDAIPRKLVLRGLSVRGGVLAVGYSFYARRERRLKEAAGGVMMFKDGALAAMVDGPFSQVYDVLPVDGRRTEHAGAPRTGEELHGMFERDVGPLVYDRSLPSPGLISVLR